MASISRSGDGKRRIQFTGPDGVRKTLRLGEVSQRTAESVRCRVERLLQAKTTGMAADVETSAWLRDIGDELHKRLTAVGLATPRQAATAVLAVTLGEFMEQYIAGRTDVKPASKLVWGHVQRNLSTYFGEQRDVETITPGDADCFKQWMITQGLAATTIHKRLQFARTFFRAMLRRRIISENPFADVKSPAAGVQTRQRFVTCEEITSVLEACPSHHWRSIVALARYGGLRCPSEVLSLRWQDIDWDTGRIVVTSPKTEHHAGKATRTTPLFPELRPILAESFDLAPTGAVYVVDEKFRRAATTAAGWANANLRTTFEKIIRRAGLTAWPRLFHNLRASRETELVERYPVHVVATWLGNTPAIALRHYLMTTDEHFTHAIQSDAKSNASECESVTQNPTQPVSATFRQQGTDKRNSRRSNPICPVVANCGDTRQLPTMEAGEHQ